MSLGDDGTVIPSSFFGLSVEYNQLPALEALGPVFDRVVSIIHPQPGMVLRLGGRSADRLYWQTSTKGAPRGVFELNPPWSTQLAALVKRDRFRVMLDLNLAVHSPSSAASFAKAVVGALPRSTVTGLTVGNEPDLYNHEAFLAKERIPSTDPLDAAQLDAQLLAVGLPAGLQGLRGRAAQGAARRPGRRSRDRLGFARMGAARSRDSGPWVRSS